MFIIKLTLLVWILAVRVNFLVSSSHAVALDDYQTCGWLFYSPACNDQTSRKNFSCYNFPIPFSLTSTKISANCYKTLCLIQILLFFSTTASLFVHMQKRDVLLTLQISCRSTRTLSLFFVLVAIWNILWSTTQPYPATGKLVRLHLRWWMIEWDVLGCQTFPSPPPLYP